MRNPITGVTPTGNGCESSPPDGLGISKTWRCTSHYELHGEMLHVASWANGNIGAVWNSVGAVQSTDGNAWVDWSEIDLSPLFPVSESEVSDTIQKLQRMLNVLRRVEVFSYDYVWVNTGEWRSSSQEAAALEAAKTDFFVKANSAPEYDRIVLDEVPCHDDHKDICAHWKVTFYATVKEDHHV